MAGGSNVCAQEAACTEIDFGMLGDDADDTDNTAGPFGVDDAAATLDDAAATLDKSDATLDDAAALLDDAAATLDDAAATLDDCDST